MLIVLSDDGIPKGVVNASLTVTVLDVNETPVLSIPESLRMSLVPEDAVSCHHTCACIK